MESINSKDGDPFCVSKRFTKYHSVLVSCVNWASCVFEVLDALSSCGKIVSFETTIVDRQRQFYVKFKHKYQTILCLKLFKTYQITTDPQFKISVSRIPVNIINIEKETITITPLVPDYNILDYYVMLNRRYNNDKNDTDQFIFSSIDINSSENTVYVHYRELFIGSNFLKNLKLIDKTRVVVRKINENVQEEKSIIIDDIPKNWTDVDIANAFSQFGVIDSIYQNTSDSCSWKITFSKIVKKKNILKHWESCKIDIKYSSIPMSTIVVTYIPKRVDMEKLIKKFIQFGVFIYKKIFKEQSAAIITFADPSRATLAQETMDGYHYNKVVHAIRVRVDTKLPCFTDTSSTKELSDRTQFQSNIRKRNRDNVYRDRRNNNQRSDNGTSANYMPVKGQYTHDQNNRFSLPEREELKRIGDEDYCNRKSKKQRSDYGTSANYMPVIGQPMHKKNDRLSFSEHEELFVKSSRAELENIGGVDYHHRKSKKQQSDYGTSANYMPVIRQPTHDKYDQLSFSEREELLVKSSRAELENIGEDDYHHRKSEKQQSDYGTSANYMPTIGQQTHDKNNQLSFGEREELLVKSSRTELKNTGGYDYHHQKSEKQQSDYGTSANYMPTIGQPTHDKDDQLSFSERKELLVKSSRAELNKYLDNIQSHPNYMQEFVTFKDDYCKSLSEGADIDMKKFKCEWNEHMKNYIIASSRVDLADKIVQLQN